ncbi:MAG: hypothetical protein K0R29_2640 [Pseudobdellovibrio sp.]|nr:hypothetical protein [Pseudobdellovibrio sp.]
MNQYNHLIAFDLSSYGAALALVNQFVDNDGCRDFELSPCGTSAQLILLVRDALSLKVIREQASSLLKSQILDVQTVENINSQLLPCYLSQTKTSLQKKLYVFEGIFVASGLALMQELLSQGAQPVDFRVVRTSPKNVILTVTGESALDTTAAGRLQFKTTVIDSIQPSLKEFFQV